MNKEYKVTYKIIFNEQLKKVQYKDSLTYPLYLQLTYRRKTTNIKSVGFETYSNPGFLNQKPLEAALPSKEEIIKKEERLIAFIIGELAGEFSFESFKHTYNYYSTDFLKALEGGFRAYILVFFVERNLSDLGKTIAEGSKSGNLYKILQDLEKSIYPEIYRDLIEKSISSHQPYLPIYGFLRLSGVSTVNIMEWQSDSMREAFGSYLEKHHSDEEIKFINKGVSSWLNMLESN